MDDGTQLFKITPFFTYNQPKEPANKFSAIKNKSTFFSIIIITDHIEKVIIIIIKTKRKTLRCMHITLLYRLLKLMTGWFLLAITFTILPLPCFYLSIKPSTKYACT